MKEREKRKRKETKRMEEKIERDKSGDERR